MQKSALVTSRDLSQDLKLWLLTSYIISLIGKNNWYISGLITLILGIYNWILIISQTVNNSMDWFCWEHLNRKPWFLPTN